jgi:peptide/nickel transport system permease protein
VVFLARCSFSLVSSPGDRRSSSGGRRPEAVAALREEAGPHQPHQAVHAWLRDSLTGDFGRSVTGKEVSQLIRTSLPPTLQLAFVAFTFGNVLGMTLGVIAGIQRGKVPDVAIGILSSILIAVPSFVAGLLILLVFSVWLGWFPSAGHVAFTEDPAEALKHVALPALPRWHRRRGDLAVHRQSLVDTLPTISSGRPARGCRNES